MGCYCRRIECLSSALHRRQVVVAGHVTNLDPTVSDTFSVAADVVAESGRHESTVELCRWKQNKEAGEISYSADHDVRVTSNTHQ